MGSDEMDRLKRLIAHLGIILSGIILVFYMIDMFNAKSLFMDSAAADGVSILLSIISISMACIILKLKGQKE
jgi:hypothetical protein